MIVGILLFLSFIACVFVYLWADAREQQHRIDRRNALRLEESQASEQAGEDLLETQLQLLEDELSPGTDLGDIGTRLFRVQMAYGQYGHLPRLRHIAHVMRLRIVVLTAIKNRHN